MDQSRTPTVPVNNRLYYSFSGAAESLGISESTLRREVNKRKIRYMVHPSGKIFAPEWLTEYCDSKTVAPLNKIKR